jgi:phosphoribosyl-AMP cyclohydrolase / phosphoribosyl-ATP pyrophosphohydrolase
MTSIQEFSALAWDKGGGLLPTVVQDARTARVLMLGYMNREALEMTLVQQRVTFFSRSKNRLWTKGESSQHYLELVSIAADCDHDSLLVTAHPIGPTCHTGSQSCFGDAITSLDGSSLAFLLELESIIGRRILEQPSGSYTAKLWSQGPTRMAQKVGEEGVEVALASVTGSEQELVGEAADLLFHLALLLKSRNLSLRTVIEELAKRHSARA